MYFFFKNSFFFHFLYRCVRLGKFDTDRTITFVPPDGEFELMRYRVSTISQPIKVLPNISEEGKNKILINIKVNADFQDDKKASNVIIKVCLKKNYKFLYCLCSLYVYICYVIVMLIYFVLYLYQL